MPEPPAPAAAPAVRDLAAYLESIAPLALQESYDNAGLLTGDPEMAISGVLVSLDATEAVLQEAIDRGCNVVVCHHPIIFRGLKRLTGATYVERVVIMAVRHGLAIYAIHTNLDNVLYRGVNGRIAERLGLRKVRVLLPSGQAAASAGTGGGNDSGSGSDSDRGSDSASGSSPGEADPNGVGSGAIGELPEPLDEDAWLDLVQTRMQAPCVRHTPRLGRPVRRVALCGGSGVFLLDAARRAGADAFLTADVKYHQFFDADGHLLLTDIGHYESEQFTVDLLQELISEKFPNFAAYCAQARTNPVHYKV